MTKKKKTSMTFTRIGEGRFEILHARNAGVIRERKATSLLRSDGDKIWGENMRQGDLI